MGFPAIAGAGAAADERLSFALLLLAVTGFEKNLLVVVVMGVVLVAGVVLGAGSSFEKNDVNVFCPLLGFAFFFGFGFGFGSSWRFAEPDICPVALCKFRLTSNNLI
jgi:hypothetical protein